MTTAGTSTRLAKARVRWTGADYCSACRSSDPDRYLRIEMLGVPPVGDGATIIVDEAEPLTLCPACVSTAARRLGLFREPHEDPDVQQLVKDHAAATEQLDAANMELAAVLKRFDAGGAA